MLNPSPWLQKPEPFPTLVGPSPPLGSHAPTLVDMDRHKCFHQNGP